MKYRPNAPAFLSTSFENVLGGISRFQPTHYPVNSPGVSAALSTLTAAVALAAHLHGSSRPHEKAVQVSSQRDRARFRRVPRRGSLGKGATMSFCVASLRTNSRRQTWQR